MTAQTSPTERQRVLAMAQNIKANGGEVAHIQRYLTNKGASINFAYQLAKAIFDGDVKLIDKLTQSAMAHV